VKPCKPGWGHGDKNHCHSGPPGQNKHFIKHHGKKHADKHHGYKARSIATRLIDASPVRATSPSGLGILGLAAAALAFGAVTVLPKRRRQ
jgi:hypothetical protein